MIAARWLVEHLRERVAADHLAHVVAHHAVDPLLGGICRPGTRAEVARIVDPPDHVVVDHELLAVLGLDLRAAVLL